MASKLYVSEYVDFPQQAGTAIGVAAEPSVDQVVDYSGGVAASTAFAANTRFVRIHTDSICCIAFGTAPVATVNNKRMAAGATEYFAVPNGALNQVTPFKVSAIATT